MANQSTKLVIPFFNPGRLEGLSGGETIQGHLGDELVTYADSNSIRTLRRSSEFQIETLSREIDRYGMFCPDKCKVESHLSNNSRDSFVRASYTAADEMMKRRGI